MYFNAALAYLLPFLTLVVGQDTSLAEVKSAFEAANIPTDLHLTFNPQFLFEVTFPEGTESPITLHAGVQLPRNATAGPPTFAAVDNGSGDLGRGPFVVATVDPDAPTPQDPTEAQIRHFLGPNFLAALPSDRLHPLKNITAALSEFLQPTPPAGSPAHRYIFLLFRQPAGFNSQTLVNATTSISNFNISAFAAATGLGRPIAGTFMMVAPDPTA